MTGVHLRHKVEHAIRIASSVLLYFHEPTFALQPPPELRVGDCRQQADHRDRYCTLTNKVYLPLEDVIRIIVEADDEAAQHLHPVALHVPYRVYEIAACVLALLRLFQAFHDRCLDADKNLPESGGSHLLEQLIVVSEVHAGFRSKCKRVLVARRPFGQLRHQQPDVLLVTDKIVVNDEDLTTPANTQQRVQFGENLLIALRAWDAAVNFYDVAEFTIEWTAARVLHGHVAVLREFGQPEIRNRRQRQRRSLWSLVDCFRLATRKI